LFYLCLGFTYIP